MHVLRKLPLKKCPRLLSSIKAENSKRREQDKAHQIINKRKTDSKFIKKYKAWIYLNNLDVLVPLDARCHRPLSNRIRNHFSFCFRFPYFSTSPHFIFNCFPLWQKKKTKKKWKLINYHLTRNSSAPDTSAFSAKDRFDFFKRKILYSMERNAGDFFCGPLSSLPFTEIRWFYA